MLQKYDENNAFAKILRNELPCKKIYENEHALCFHDINPVAQVHALIIPKGAYITFTDFAQKADKKEIISFFEAVKEVIQILKLNGYKLVSNNEKEGGQEVPHFHMHIIGPK